MHRQACNDTCPGSSLPSSAGKQAVGAGDRGGLSYSEQQLGHATAAPAERGSAARALTATMPGSRAAGGGGLPKPIGGKRREAAEITPGALLVLNGNTAASPELSRSAPNVFPNAHRREYTMRGARHRDRVIQGNPEPRAPTDDYTPIHAPGAAPHRSQRDLLPVPELAFGALQFGLWGFGGVFMRYVSPWRRSPAAEVQPRHLGHGC